MSQKVENYLKDISEIRSIMERSSRFISLSGLSGILAGIYALIGALVAHQILEQNSILLSGNSIFRFYDSQTILLLILDAAIVLMLAIGTGIILTIRQSKRKGQKIWDSTAKRLLMNLFIPLASGGILCLIFLSKGYLGVVMPLTLIFYGLALVNGSKYTLHDIRSLGIVEIILGLLAAYFVGYGLYFWAIGFGIMHIVYGVVMYYKYER